MQDTAEWPFIIILSAFRTLKDKFKQTGHLHAKLFRLGFVEWKAVQNLLISALAIFSRSTETF